MKITEITHPARKEMKQLSDLYISYAASNSVDLYIQLDKLIDMQVDSSNQDIKNNAIYYRNLLEERVFLILSKH